MKRLFHIVLCSAILFSNIGFAVGQSSLKELWYANYKTDMDISSVHYTTNVIVVVFEDKHEKSLAIGKLTYCSGEKLNDELILMRANVLPDTIQAYESRIFFVSSDKESEYELTCADLNLTTIWSYRFTDPIDKTSIWVEVKDNLLWLNVDKGVMVFDIKIGRMLSKLETKHIYKRIYAGCLLVQTNTLKLTDPNTGIDQWNYTIPESGMRCFGVDKGIVMLASKPTKDNASVKMACLDANNGKELFLLDYNTEIVQMGISRNLLCVVTKEKNGSFTIDAFDIENWMYIWTLKKQCLPPSISDNSIFTVCSKRGDDMNLSKIDPFTGKVDKDSYLFFLDSHNAIFFRKIAFHANRVIVAFGGITCFIDQSF